MAVDPLSRYALPSGAAGTDRTIAAMDQLAMGPYGARNAKVRDQANRILLEADVPEKDRAAEICAIHAWVQRSIRYVADPVGAEWLTAPEAMIAGMRYGDCDDHSVLEAALLGAIGLRTRFVVVGRAFRDVFDHVYLAVLLNGKWVPLDPIAKTQPPGWEVPSWKVRKVYPENGRARRPDAALMLAIGAGLGLVALAAFPDQVRGAFDLLRGRGRRR